MRVAPRRNEVLQAASRYFSVGIRVFGFIGVVNDKSVNGHSKRFQEYILHRVNLKKLNSAAFYITQASY